MAENNNESQNKSELLQLKQTFLSSAISDLAGNIHFLDTKVSIIMAALVALIAGTLSSMNSIQSVLRNIPPCNWLAVLLIVLSLVYLISTLGVFIFGIITISGHKSKIQYDSKWFLTHSKKQYNFETYKNDVFKMNSYDIIENMVAELYKLNDINNQKLRTMKWVIITFSVSLISASLIGLILLLTGG